MERLANYIDGELAAPASSLYIENYNPAEGKVYSFIPDSDNRDVENAAQAARRAFKNWSEMSADKRCAILRVADLIDRDLDQLAVAESVDNGKPVKLAKSLDIPRASANIRFYAQAAIHLASEAHITGVEAVNYTLRVPSGVAGCISPWNLPLYLFTWKIAPALAARMHGGGETFGSSRQ